MFKYIKTISIFSIWAIFWTPVFGANITVQNQHISVGEEIVVPIILDTEGEIINAVSGKIKLYGGAASLARVNEKNSFISFWLTRPSLNLNEISFSGIVPGGFRGVIGPGVDSYDSGVILNVIVRGRQAGTSELSIQIDDLVKHSASQENIDVPEKVVNIQVDEAEDDAPVGYKTLDTVPPEDFKPIIIKSDLISNTGYGLVFQARDANSGIDHYEIKIGNGEWKRGESPYPLEYEEINSILYVRAVDRAGNSREVVAGKGTEEHPTSYLNLIVLGIIALIVLYLIYKLWRRGQNIKKRRFL